MINLNKGLVYIALFLLLVGCKKQSILLDLDKKTVEVNSTVSSCDLIATINSKEIELFTVANNQVQISSTEKLTCYPINTNELGITTATFDFNGKTWHEEISVVDTESPSITVDEMYTVEQGNSYFDLRKLIFVADNSNENIEPEVDGIVNVEVPGLYEVKVVASDSSGNTKTVDVKVEVSEKEKEIVTVIEREPSKSIGTDSSSSNSDAQNPVEPSSPSNKSKEKPKNKRFLFSEGFTKETALSSCQTYRQEEFSKTGYTGTGYCNPITNDIGIYIGYEAIFN